METTKMRKKKLTQTEQWKKLSTDYYENLSEEQKELRAEKSTLILQSHLFTSLPQSWEDSKRFGWLRGLALLTETHYKGKWHSWLMINAKGELTEEDDIPHYDMDESKTFYNIKRPKQHNVTHMLSHCLEHIVRDGGDIRDFIEWIGYSLGISWFKKPKIRNDETWKKLYEDFVLDLFWLEPSDYFSHFISAHGQGGVLDYFPTPIHITKVMNMMIDASMDRMEILRATTNEPCLGGAAMHLNNKSLNLVGQELSPIMVKVASIQAFIYLPHLLYTPKPIIGLHANKENMTINRYFEFDTDTRIYQGDSHLGEFVVPKHIFKEDSEYADIYFFPVDVTKIEWFQLEEEFLKHIHSGTEMTKDFLIKVTRAQARLIKMNRVLTNPPFDVKLGKRSAEIIKELYKSNKIFFEEREKRLGDLAERISLSDEVKSEVEIKIQIAKDKINKKQIEGQMELILN